MVRGIDEFKYKCLFTAFDSVVIEVGIDVVIEIIVFVVIELT
jgi:hypothetical protein